MAAPSPPPATDEQVAEWQNTLMAILDRIEADRAEVASLRAAVLALREALEQIRKLDTRRTPTGDLDVGLIAEIANTALARKMG